MTLDKHAYLKNLQDQLKLEKARYETGLINFMRASNSAEYTTALREIPYLNDEPAVQKVIDLLKDKQEDVVVRALAFQKALSSISRNLEYVTICLNILKDNTEPVELRIGILTMFRSLSFSSKFLVSLRADYMTALRILLDEPNHSLREMATEELAKHKDEYVQRRLLNGLSGAEVPLVLPAKAIQLLNYDIHAEHFPIVRHLLEQRGTDEMTRVEAVHALANDPESMPLLERLVKDPAEDIEVRMISATALSISHPEDFIEMAKDLIADEKQDKNIRAVCLNALMHQQHSDALYNDPGFLRKINQLQRKTDIPDLKKLSREYLDNAEKHIKKQ